MPEIESTSDRFHRLLPSRTSGNEVESGEKGQEKKHQAFGKPVSEKMMERLKVVIMGGGRVGQLLTSLLRAEKHQVTLIEYDRERSAQLAEKFPDVLVVNGDGTDIRILRDAGTDMADIFVAVTGKDNLNYVSAQIAKKSLNVSKVIARVNDPLNENNFIRVGIDKLVTTTKATAGEILGEISGGRTVLPLAGVRFEILYAILGDDSPMVGKRVKRCGLPRKAFIISLNREGEPIVPDDMTTLRAGDLIAVLTPLETADKVKTVLVKQ